MKLRDKLIKILIVVGIVVIVAGITFVFFYVPKQTDQARDARRWSDVRSILKAANSYALDHDVPDCANLGTDIPADGFYRWIGASEECSKGSDYTKDSDCQAVWLMDGNLNDACGDNDGTSNGATYIPDGRFGGAYEFDGQDSFIKLNQEVDMTYNNSSISWWMKRNEEDHECIFSINKTRVYGMIEVGDRISGGSNPGLNQIRIEMNANNKWQRNFYTGITMDDGKWHHYLLVFGSADSKLYVDGNLADTRDTPTDSTGLTIRYFGYQQKQVPLPYGDWFKGIIDEVVVFDRVLEPTEIQEIYFYGLTNYGLVGEPYCDLSDDLGDYLAKIPEDPTGAEGDCTGYLIKRDSSGVIWVKAPYKSYYTDEEIVVSQ